MLGHAKCPSTQTPFNQFLWISRSCRKLGGLFASPAESGAFILCAHYHIKQVIIQYYLSNKQQDPCTQIQFIMCRRFLPSKSTLRQSPHIVPPHIVPPHIVPSRTRLLLLLLLLLLLHDQWSDINRRSVSAEEKGRPSRPLVRSNGQRGDWTEARASQTLSSAAACTLVSARSLRVATQDGAHGVRVGAAGARQRALHSRRHW
jgi:hypothetical protein